MTRKIRISQILQIFAYIILAVILLGAGVSFAQAAEKGDKAGRVLFVSSYSYAWDTVAGQMEGIKDTLGDGISIDYEFMDTKRVDTEESWQMFHDGMQYRLSQVEPYDVVILGDDAAFRFALEYREELFGGIPLVFEGVNDEQLAREASKDPLITGVLEKASVEKNIDLGLMLAPDAAKVVAILDDTVTGQAERELFYSYADRYPNLAFTEINSSLLSTRELKKQLGQVGSDSILIYIIMTEDADGKRYDTSWGTARLIAETAKVPCIRMVESGIGEGVLGGNVVSMYKSGEIAAQMAKDIMEGRDTGSIDMVVESPNIYCVDETVMKRFGLDMSLLPEGTVIINHQPTFMERNREALAPFGILLAAMLVILLVIFIDNIRRRGLLQEISKAKGIMESASQHDFLTGLSNRSKFMEDLERIIAEKHPCNVIMLDIDDFKKINDTLGHTAGDEALKQVADRLKEMQSQILTPYRFAGDEFIIIMKSSQQKLVEKTAYQCRQIFTKPFVLAGEKRKICGSIGIAAYPRDTDNLEDLIVCADAAMYHVKKNGKNDFAFYQAGDKEEL